MANSEKHTVVENFDGFVMLRSTADSFDQSQVRICIQSLTQLASQGQNLIFLDLAKAQVLPQTSLDLLATELKKLKTTHQLEVVLLSEPALAAQLKTSSISQVTQLFERRDQSAARILTKKVLRESSGQLQMRFESTMEGAIQSAVKRWMGQPPSEVNLVSVTVNPSIDVVSVVSLHIDGCPFRVFLSSPQATLRNMVAQILKSDITITDPAILDGACEVLNYLTAYFRQQFSVDDTVVEADPPQLLQPEEMMSILDQDLAARRVKTGHGSFDVWFEVAA